MNVIISTLHLAVWHWYHDIKGISQFKLQVSCCVTLELMVCAATSSNFLLDLPDQRHSANILSKPAGHAEDGLFSRQETSSSSISPFSSSLGADDLPGSAADMVLL